MKPNIKSCDLKLLLHLFQDEARKIVLYDAKHPLEEDCPLDFVQYGDVQALEKYIKLNAVPISIINISRQDISYLYKEKEVRCIIDFENQIKQSSRRFHYINNPSGGMRWIFPTEARYPSFLSLYNGSGVKAAIYRWLCQLAFFFGMKKSIVSGTFSVLSKAAHLDEILKKESFDSFSIFTGTIGPNRKMVLATDTDTKTTHFFKIPLTEQSRLLVQQEYEQLLYLKTLKIKAFDYPEVAIKGTCIKLSNVANRYSKNSVDLGDFHLDALEEIYIRTAQTRPLLALDYWDNSLENLDFIETNRGLSKLNYPRLFNALAQFSEELEPATRIKTSLIHGDFTPWNMYEGKGKLQIYDWELAKDGYPLLYDFFHYVFQSNVLIKRQGYPQIKDELIAFFKQERFVKLCEKYEIDWQFYLRLYLFHIVGYYVKLYMVQPNLHVQAHWLLDTWQEALCDGLKHPEQTVF